MPSELLATIERYERAKAELDDTIRDAHTTIKTLRRVAAECDQRAVAVQDALKDTTHDIVSGYIDRYLKAIGPMIRSEMKLCMESIRRDFRRIERALFIDDNGCDLRVIGEDKSPVIADRFGTIAMGKQKRKPSGRRITARKVTDAEVDAAYEKAVEEQSE